MYGCSVIRLISGEALGRVRRGPLKLSVQHQAKSPGRHELKFPSIIHPKKAENSGVRQVRPQVATSGAVRKFYYNDVHG